MTERADPATWWLRLALGDLTAARTLLVSRSMPVRGAAQFAQQAAEKALKAVIASGGTAPTRTHDLVYLVLRCDAAVQGDLAMVDVTLLSAVLAAARYPEVDDPPIRRDQAERWVADAEAVITVAARHLDMDLTRLEAA